MRHSPEPDKLLHTVYMQCTVLPRTNIVAEHALHETLDSEVPSQMGS